MKIKEIKELSQLELERFKHSDLYLKVLNNYALCDIHMAYYAEYFGDTWNDVSIVAFDDSDFYLCMYMFSNGDELSFRGVPVYTYYQQADSKVLIRVYQELFAKLEVCKQKCGISRLKIYDNHYFVFKYFDSIYETRIEHYSYVDLLQSEDEIRMNIRKSYKSLVNWGYKNLDIKIYDSKNIEENVICQFENFHIQVSQRRTRTHESWLLQYEAVKQGMAYIVFGFFRNKLAAAVLVLNNQTEAYYGVAVNDRELMARNLPVGHAILLEAIFIAKRSGIKKFNLGNVSSSSDDKLNKIAKYKRGFSSVIETKLAYTLEL